MKGIFIKNSRKKETRRGEPRLRSLELWRGEDGFFVIYAILFTSVMLTIGMAILDISLKQLSFSGIDRESIRSFYSADSGMECALYGDMVGDGGGDTVFSTSSPGTLRCNGDNINLTPVTTSPPKFEFYLYLNKNNDRERTCAHVVLDREIKPVGDPNAGSVGTTTVSSLGYNTDCPSQAYGPKRFPVVERGLRATY